MITKIKTKLLARMNNGSFLSSTIILFVANIIVAIFNYAVVIVASRTLGGDYSLWTALNGVVTILMTINVGIYTNIIRTVAKLNKDNQQAEILSYYNWYRKILTRIVVAGLLFSPIFAWMITSFVSGTSLLVSELLVVFIFTNLLLGVQQNFLIGTLQNLPFAFGMIGANLIRLVATCLLLTYQRQITALPLGLIAGSVIIELISNYYWQQKTQSIKKTLDNPELVVHDVQLKVEIRHSVVTILSMVSLSILLNINPILIQNSNISPDAKDLFAVIFNFGQIIHFASIAGLAGLVAYSAQSSNKRIYFVALSIATFVTAVVCCGFYFGGEIMLKVFGRSQYLDELSVIIKYAIFIGFYNIIYVSAQYLLAKGRFFQIYVLIFGVIITILGSNLIPKPNNGLIQNQILPNIDISIAIGLFTAVLLVTKVCRSKFQS